MTPEERIKEIKLELRSQMNGIASSAMRQSEDYRVNFGVELPRLQEMAEAESFNPITPLASALWKESVRECRILALMIFPKEEMDEELCDVWAEQIHTSEIAQIASLHLFRKLPYATSKSLEWIASENEVLQVCGFTTLLHIARQTEIAQRTLDEVVDQAQAAMESESLSLRKIASQWMTYSEPKTY